MIKYDGFILERMWNGSRKLTEGQFWKLYKDNCQEHDVNIKIYKNFDNNNISDEDFLIMDKIKNRRSSMDGNYYTLMMNNMEAWKEYPKRSQICSLNDSYRGYTTHFVIPYDKSKWGVCSTPDIWGMYFIDGEYKVLPFSNIANIFNLTEIRDDNWENFLNDIENISKDDFVRLQHIFRRYGIRIGKEEDILKFFVDQLNPVKLGFKLRDYKELNMIKGRKEIWTDSPCLYVNEYKYKKILPKMIEMKTKKFLKNA